MVAVQGVIALPRVIVPLFTEFQFQAIISADMSVGVT
jgi:hypothetical protein